MYHMDDISGDLPSLVGGFNHSEKYYIYNYIYIYIYMCVCVLCSFPALNPAAYFYRHSWLAIRSETEASAATSCNICFQTS